MSTDEHKQLHDIAGQLADTIFEQAQSQDICPHCLGLDVIYMLARTIAANMEIDAGELFNMVHMGILDGESDPDGGDNTDDDAPEWTVH